MISNDMVLNTSAFIMLFFLLAWGTCFFVFVYKRLGGPKVGKDSLLYFNFMFFKRDVLANFSLAFLVLGYMSAASVEYRREFDGLMLLANLSGACSFLLFAIYGRFFYHDAIEYEKPFFFVKVFLAKLDVTFGSMLLWLSRLAYITWLIIFIRNG
ncbi:Uncharacterised protein [Yersinia rohdei]|uniref:hypothetical protein n=1 Tax=Yersinia rohdei TaxID=29485 RepID=UPI00061C8B7A|nr:hypothetical protein [Yersinia rohdei]CNF47417.1 Uncharacterised protein [Yersinia rohdei]